MAKKTTGGKPAAAAKKKKPAAPVTTFALSGVGKKGTGSAVSKEGNDGVTRTRAQWNGYSLCSLLKWVGFNGGTLDNCRTLVASLGLDGVTAGSTLSCQHGAGVALANGTEPNHGGQPADLDKPTAATVRKLAGM